MPGGINQLALYGKEDALLSGNPDVTYWRLIHRRYSIFSTESILQPFQSEATFGRRVVLPITKSGDLMYSVFLEIDLPSLRDYAIDTVVSAATSIPGMISARWTSSTTARVKVIPSTDGLDDSYDLYVDDGSSPVTVNGAAGVTDIEITGLNKSSSYTVKVRRVASSTAGTYSSTLPISSVRWTNSIAHAMIRTVDLEIGGARISRLTGEYMDVDAELSLPSEKEDGFNDMIGKYKSYDLYDNSFQEARKIFLPINLSFATNPGLSIPLVSLVYHQMNLVFDFRDYTEVIRSTHAISSLISQSARTPSPIIEAYVTFVFLGTQERRKFLESSHEILFQDIQFYGDVPVIVSGGDTSLQKKYDLTFNHPVSEIIWTYNRANSYNSGLSPSAYATNGNDYFNYDAPAGSQIDPIASAVIHVNGHPRYSERSGKYHRLVQPYGHHTRIPSKKVYSYSFGLDPESPHPTGSINFSRADTAHLQVKFDDSFSAGGSNGRLRVYARTLNILKISGGMATLMFTST
jgi:hypothetical protein